MRSEAGACSSFCAWMRKPLPARQTLQVKPVGATQAIHRVDQLGRGQLTSFDEQRKFQQIELRCVRQRQLEPARPQRLGNFPLHFTHHRLAAATVIVAASVSVWTAYRYGDLHRIARLRLAPIGPCADEAHAASRPVRP
jgi:hypothetical protein